MKTTSRYLSLLAVCCLTAACNGLTGTRVSSLPPSPTQPVDQRTLGPMTLDPDKPGAGQTAADAAEAGTEAAEGEAGTSADGLAADARTQGDQVASLSTPPAGADSSAKVGRADLLGGWKIASGADRCQLFMNLTAWQGGYRATTRGCSSPALQNISAWDLKGNQITLKDGNGAAIASAFPSGDKKYSGQTAGGTSLSFFR